jgi:hypothetical protein
MKPVRRLDATWKRRKNKSQGCGIRVPQVNGMVGPPSETSSSRWYAWPK